MPLISDRLARLAPSPTVEISGMALDMKRAGRDVIALSAGEPDFDTPEHIKVAAQKAMADGKTKYTQVDGIPELKEAIIRKFARENGIEASIDAISVGTGGKQILFNALLATLNPGNEVLIPTPYWVSFKGIVDLAEGVPVCLPCPLATGMKLTPAQLDAAITPRTKWLILNSPSNPTGVGYNVAELAAFADILRQHPAVHVISDDIYEHLCYDGFTFATLAAVAPDLQDRILTANGVSKSFCMTGWRIGYCTGPVPLMKAMAKIQSQSTSNPNSIAQYAALAALDGPMDFMWSNLAAFDRRRKMVVAALDAIDGVECPMPDGAFYVYPSIAGLIGKRTPDGTIIETDKDFAQYILQAGEVAIVPGVAFGLEPHFRVSYAAADTMLETAMTRIRDAIETLI